MSDLPQNPTSAGAGSGSAANTASPATPASMGTPKRVTFFSGEARRREREEAERAVAGVVPTAVAGPSAVNPFQKAMASMTTPDWLVPSTASSTATGIGPTAAAGPSAVNPFQKAMASMATPDWLVPSTASSTAAGIGPTAAAGPSAVNPFQKSMASMTTQDWLIPSTTSSTAAEINAPTATRPSAQNPFQNARASMPILNKLVPSTTTTTAADFSATPVTRPSVPNPFQNAMATIAKPNKLVPFTTSFTATDNDAPTATGPSAQNPFQNATASAATPDKLIPSTNSTTAFTTAAGISAIAAAGHSAQSPFQDARAPVATPNWLIALTTPTASATSPLIPDAPKKIGSQAVPKGHSGGTRLHPSGSSPAPVSTTASNPPSTPAPAPRLVSHTVEAAAPTTSASTSTFASASRLAEAPPPTTTTTTTTNAPTPMTGNDVIQSHPEPAIGRNVSSTFLHPPSITLPPSITVPPPPPPPPAPAGPSQWAFNPRTWWQELQYVSVNHPAAWETLVGLFFQESGRFPEEVADSTYDSRILREFWTLDARKQDLEVARPLNPGFEKWRHPQGDEPFALLVAAVNIGGQETFESVVRSWAGRSPDRAEFVLWRAGWIRSTDFESFYPEERRVLRAIVMMEEGEERSRLLAQAKEESPHFVQQCLDHAFFCIAKKTTFKRKAEDGDDPEYHYPTSWEQDQYRVRGSPGFEPLECSPPKFLKMSVIGHGQPTQFHGVPLEERAVDSKGNRLPWSLEWHDDHPNARGQRRYTEEKGPFGKSRRRHGSSRTRTATPAKKENPRLDGFEKALQFSAKKAIEDQQEANALARSQTDSHTVSHSAPSHDKEPTSAILYGFSESTQWSAINSYEKASHGMICEDYDREPPAQLQKYPRTLSSTSSVKRRPLTQKERSMAFKWAGGRHWIKVTFDSAEAANRAIEHSPYPIYGKWVYAELYHGEAPHDVEIPILEGEQANARPAGRPVQTLSAAFSQQPSNQQRATATLPRSFNPAAVPQADDQRPSGVMSQSPSTASSATATDPEHSNLRNRHPSQTQEPGSSAATETVILAPGNTSAGYDPRYMRHFQNIPRTVIRPASEAYPVLPSRWERWARWLRANSLIPGDFVGDVLPRDANGNFDWNGASWYWRFWYMIDQIFGTDICALRPDPDEE